MQNMLGQSAPLISRYTFFFVLLLLSAQAVAQQSYFRLYDQTTGLNVGEIGALAQDDAGFIWVGAHRGLVRFDGRNFIAWAPDKLDELVNRIVHGPGDELLAGTANGRAWKRTADSLEPLAGPDAAPIANLVTFDFDAQGDLWAILGHELWRRDHAAHWQHIEPGIPAQETPRFVRAVGETVVVLTDLAAWRLRSTQPAELLLRQPNLWSATGDGTSTVWLVTHRDRLWQVNASGAHEMSVPNSRVIDLRMRGTTLWLALDTQLLAIEADGRMRHIDVADGLPSGGPLLVDRENSLWLGSFVGLVQFPEPDTWHWGVREGLPSLHAHALAEADATIWVSTWANGLVRINESTGELSVIDAKIPDGDICALGEHGIWATDGRHLVTWRNARFEIVADLPVPAQLGSCVADRAGNLWFATDKNLLRLAPGTTTETAIKLDTIELDPADTADLLWVGDDDQLFFANETHVCRLRSTVENAAVLENCVATGAKLEWQAYANIAPHRTWLAARVGLFEFDGTRLNHLLGNHQLEGGLIQSLAPAPGGDWWAAGAGALLRVRPCSDCAAGWTVDEAPGLWQGLPGNAALSVAETAAGDLWVAGNRGVWRVPRAVRGLPQRAPPIKLVHVQVDADTYRSQAAIELQPDDHRLELEFAALSFRDRSLLQYRSRIGDEGEWSAPSHDAHLQFAALEPGVYRAEMSASLDGEHWSDPPAAVDFNVLPAWYRTLWARLLFGIAALALLALIYRLRVAALLRVESERTRIAMDLHDEIGAGLGSIGMLAGAAARTHSDSVEQQRIVREIAEVSNLLGSGLRSLVWSLRSGKAGLAELGEQIADHARRLFPGDEPQLSLRLPTTAQTLALAPQVRRHVLLFVLEALHNVSRHAHAHQVHVSLDATADQGFVLHIEDDGRGFDISRDATGTGLESMHRRANAIDAGLDITSVSGGGTCITLIHPRKDSNERNPA